MILKLNTYNYFFSDSTFKYYAIENPNESVIEAIYCDGEELDLTKAESYDLAIDFLKDCKECDFEICDAYKSPIIETLFGSTLIKDIDKFYESMNEKTDNIIELLTSKKNTLHTDEDLPCKTCCSCSGTDYCKTCQEVNTPEVSDASEVTSNTRTLHWAQKYMDTVLDPASKLTNSEYHSILALLVQYGDWILKQ